MKLSPTQFAAVETFARTFEDMLRGPMLGDCGEGPLNRFRSSRLQFGVHAEVARLIGRRIVSLRGSIVKCAPKTRPCGRCGGGGFIEAYAHNGGQCFACG